MFTKIVNQRKLCPTLNMCILVLAYFATQSFWRNHQHPSERKVKPQTHPLKSNEGEWRFKTFHFQTSQMFSYEFYLFRINLKKVIIQNALHLKKKKVVSTLRSYLFIHLLNMSQIITSIHVLRCVEAVMCSLNISFL